MGKKGKKEQQTGISAQELFRRISQVENDQQRLYELLWLLQAPNLLYRLHTVTSNLQDILEVAGKTWSGILQRMDLNWLPELLVMLAPIAKEVQAHERSPKEDAEGEVELEPADAGLPRRSRTGYPLYACLACEIRHDRKGDLYTIYRKLQAHFLFAFIKQVRKEQIAPPDNHVIPTSWPELTFEDYYPGQSLRFLCGDQEPEAAEQVLRSFSVDLPPDAFAAQVRNENPFWNVLNKGTWEYDRIRYIGVFIEQAYGIKGRRGRNVWNSRESGWGTEIGDPDDQNFNLGNLSSGHRSGTTSGEGDDLPGDKKERLDYDDCPDEDEEEFFFWDTGDDEFQKATGSFEGAMLAHQNQLVRENKMFAFGYRSLLPADLVRIEVDWREEITRLLTRAVLPKKTLEKVELCALALLSLWTGSTIEKASKLRWVQDLYGSLDCDLVLVENARVPIAFRARVPFPKYAEPQPPADFNRDQDEFVFLPDAMDIGGLLKMLLARKEGLQGEAARDYVVRNDTEVFTDGVDYVRSLRSLLGRTDDSNRVTLAKLVGTLYRRVVAASGKDIVAATMITGQDEYLARVPMFYACRRMRRIQDIYVDAVMGLRNEIWEEVGRTHSTAPPHYIAPKSKFIGSRLCPTKEAVQDAILRLKGHLTARRPITPEEIRTYHNRFTLYSIWYFAFATGIRGIITPYVHPSDISPLNSMAVLRDKDSDAGFKAKMTWIPQPVKEQMKFHENSNERLAVQPDKDVSCFFLKDDGGWEKVRPKTIKPKMDEFLPGFPAAVHRRFMFNELLDAGCPPEIVRIWMGHAVHGDEPWARHATFCFGQYRAVLERYLLPLLDDLGFAPTESLL